MYRNREPCSRDDVGMTHQPQVCSPIIHVVSISFVPYIINNMFVRSGANPHSRNGFKIDFGHMAADRLQAGNSRQVNSGSTKTTVEDVCFFIESMRTEEGEMIVF